MSKNNKSNWMFHMEWGVVMLGIIGACGFMHHEHSHAMDRIDNHINQTQECFNQINRRIDDQSKRSDELHKEFYALLKQMNKEK